MQKKNNMLYNETCAVTGDNIEDSFFSIAIKASMQDDTSMIPIPKNLQSNDIVNIEEKFNDNKINTNRNNNEVNYNTNNDEYSNPQSSCYYC